MKYRTQQERIFANEQNKCKVKGCTRHRKYFSGYCSTHNAAKVAYGDPLGHRTYPKSFEREAMKVKLLLEANSQHGGIKQGIAFFQQWIEGACTQGGVLGQKHFLRLNDERVTGAELLQEVAALYLYSHTYPWDLEEGLPLDYATGIAVLCKSHNKRGTVSCQHVPSALRRKVGQYVREKIGRLLYNIVRTIQQQDKQEELQSEAQSQPLYPRVIYLKGETH